MLDIVWALVDPAEIETAQPADMKLLYDSRSFNDGCVYIGRYSDPNHANGFRIISLLDEMKDGKRMAKCQGIGGMNEPPSFILPAWVNSDNSIVIDFSAPPKNGPKDFKGNWDEDGIKFVKDGNKWPMVPKTREENLTAFLKNFDSFEDEDEQEISKDDFVKHYTEVAQSFANEQKFINFLEECWGVAEKPDAVPFVSGISTLVNHLREAIADEVDDIDDQEKMDEFFYLFDLDRNQTLDLMEFEVMFNHLGLVYERKQLNALMKCIDKDYSTTLDKDEFQKLVRDQL